MKRRQILAAASAAALAPIAAIAVDASVSVLPQAENPTLLALGEELPRIEAEYHAACAAWDAMWREWSPKWPLAPDPCVTEGSGFSYEIERDLTGEGLVRAGRKSPLRLLTLNHLEWRRDHMLAVMAKDARRKRKAGAKTLAYWQSEVASSELGIALLPGYLAECERIKRESNVVPLEKARWDAVHRMFAFARQVLQEPSHTVAGLRIKAQAVAALARLRRSDAMWGNMKDIRERSDLMAVLLGKAMLDLLAA